MLFYFILNALFLSLVLCQGGKDGIYRPADEASIEKIKRYLNDSPTFLNTPCWNREVWNSVKFRMSRKHIELANKAKTTPMVPFDSDKYLGKDRGPADIMQESRSSTLEALIIGECYNFDGSFLPLLENALLSIAQQPSWLFAAHVLFFLSFFDS